MCRSHNQGSKFLQPFNMASISTFSLFFLLCLVLLCSTLLCFALLCFALLCFVLLCLLVCLFVCLFLLPVVRRKEGRLASYRVEIKTEVS